MHEPRIGKQFSMCHILEASNHVSSLLQRAVKTLNDIRAIRIHEWLAGYVFSISTIDTLYGIGVDVSTIGYYASGYPASTGVSVGIVLRHH